MAPVKGRVPGVFASNIIEGSRKRGRPGDDEASSSPSLAGGSTIAVAGGSSSQLSGSSHDFLRTGPTEPEEVARLGFKLLNVVYHVRDVHEDDPQALLCEPFLFLPDAELYADYYQVIRKPMTLEDVRVKLARREYGSLLEARHDCEIVCQNAKRYNLKDTPIWVKAKTLHGIIKDAFADIVFAPEKASTNLDSNFKLLQDGPEDVEPITSRPPSPTRYMPAPEPAYTQPATSPPGGAGQSKGTRITIKRKPSNLEQQQQQQHYPSSGLPFNTSGSKVSPMGEDDGDEDGDMTMADASQDPESKIKRPGGRGRKLKSQMKGWARDLASLKKPDGNLASAFFQELPSRQDYPDYYTVITAPISLKEIQEKVRTREYKSPYAFVSDVRVMLANAKWYNEQDSIVWKDADALEKYLDNKVIPGLLSEGFTLDPNDTRASVLPPYMQHDDSASPAPRGTPLPHQQQSTPAGPQGGSRVKIKLQNRPSAAAASGSQTPAPGGVKPEASMAMPGAGAMSPGAAHAQSPFAAPGQPYAGSPPQQQPNRLPSATPTPGPGAAAQAMGSTLSASGRPVRNAGAARGGSPQALTAGSPPLTQRLPMPGAAAPGMSPTGAPRASYMTPQQQQQQQQRLPPHASPAAAHPSYAGSPGVPHPGYARGPPSQPQLQGGYPVGPGQPGARSPYAHPQQYPQGVMPGQQQGLPYAQTIPGRLGGPAPPSAFDSPSVFVPAAEGRKQSTTVRRPAAIRSFVVLSGQSPGRRPAAKVVSLEDADRQHRLDRQVVLSVPDEEEGGESDEDADEGAGAPSSRQNGRTQRRKSSAQQCMLLFKVQDFPSSKQQQQQKSPNGEAANEDADADADGEADAEGEVDEEEADAAKPATAPAAPNGHAPGANGNGAEDGDRDVEMDTPPLPVKPRNRAWRPYIAVTVNGYSLPLRWCKSAADVVAKMGSEGEADDEEDEDAGEEANGEGNAAASRTTPSKRSKSSLAAASSSSPWPTLVPSDPSLSLAYIDMSGARLQRGTNVIDVEMAPPPPCAELQALLTPEAGVDDVTRSKAQNALDAPERYRLYVTR